MPLIMPFHHLSLLRLSFLGQTQIILPNQFWVTVFSFEHLQHLLISNQRVFQLEEEEEIPAYYESS